MTRDDVKNKIDEAASAAKSTVDHVADKTQSAAHTVGTKMEKAGKKLKESKK